MVKIRAFRAIDDPAACKKFIEGHRRVLENVGVKEVTSSKDEWSRNPAVFVILVENDDRTKVYGGARVHRMGGTQPLPLDEATSSMDPTVINLLEAYNKNATGELCGLWNSIEVAGMGIGSIFLSRAAVAICRQFDLNSMFALAAPYTVKMAQNVGFEKEESVGNHGTFYYPKINLLATVMIIKDTVNLPKAEGFERERIMDLRTRPKQITLETYREKEIEIDYDLKIPNLEHIDLNNELI